MINNAIPLRIAGVGYSVPNTVVTNEDLTKLYETSDEWIYTRTGIKERRVVSGNETAIDLGLKVDKVMIDFSVVNHVKYYNGIAFKGFIEGIPSGILSGGQYDNLMKKMNKRYGAIGFAVYLDEVSRVKGE